MKNKYNLAKFKKMILQKDTPDDSAHYGDFNPLSEVWTQSNENLQWVTQTLNPKGKDILTCGAGDQFLMFYLAGANRVDLFDISYVANICLDIKLRAIKVMNFDEYENFIIDSANDRKFDTSSALFQKILKAHPDFNADIIDYIGEDRQYLNGQMSPYALDKRTYGRIKKAVSDKSFEFILANATKLHLFLKRKYDIIYLSNVLYACNDVHPEHVIPSLLPHLNHGGMIVSYSHFAGGLNGFELLGKKVNFEKNARDSFLYKQADPKRKKR